MKIFIWIICIILSIRLLSATIKFIVRATAKTKSYTEMEISDRDFDIISDTLETMHNQRKQLQQAYELYSIKGGLHGRIMARVCLSLASKQWKHMISYKSRINYNDYKAKGGLY